MNPVKWNSLGVRLCMNGGLGAHFCVALLGILLSVAVAESARANQTTGTDMTVPVVKATESVGIIGTVVAMTREPWWGANRQIHILLIRVDHVLDEKKTENYVRADFLNHSIYDNSEESLTYDKLVTAFHEKGTWKIQLHPPHELAACYRVPPPPIPGDLLTSGNPVIQPVGGATGYPDVNTVRCYSFFAADVQEIRTPEASKERVPNR